MTPKDILIILNKNFGFTLLTDADVGEVIELSPAEAYQFSIFTGAYYLNNINIPFTPKGLTSIFNSALDYNLISSFFLLSEEGKIKPWNTPVEHVLRYPFIKNNKKYLIPLLINEGNEFSYREKIFSALTNSGKNPSDYLVLELRNNVKGYGLEPFFEYLSARYFKELGYITESQIPLNYWAGTPDIGAFKIPDIQSKLEIIIKNGGVFISELSAISSFGIPKTKPILPKEIRDSIIVGEAKTGHYTAKKQLNKYIKTGFFDKAYEINPSKNKLNEFGLITLKDNKILALDGKIKINADKKEQLRYSKWLLNYIKYYLIANFNIDQLEKFMNKQGVIELTPKNFINKINELDIKYIIDSIPYKK